MPVRYLNRGVAGRNWASELVCVRGSFLQEQPPFEV